MQTDYDRALALVLRSEGLFANNAHDPGGVTMRGVTQRVYDAYRKARGVAPESVRFIDQVELSAIYKRQYWDAVDGDGAPAGIDYCLFDEAVNSGPVKSIIDLQTALAQRGLYRGKIDGQLGLLTEAGLRSVTNRASLINSICDLRLNFLHRIKTWRFFGKGWSARVASVRATALAM